MADKPQIAPTRVAAWLDEMRTVGVDQDKAKSVLNKIRDDPNATARDREDFYRALAQQCFVWYLEAIRGKPYTPDEMAFLVSQQAEKLEAEEA